MLTRQDRIGLVVAFVLGLGDIAILAALTADDPAVRPPVGIVALSVVLGVVTLVLVAMAWRRPTRPLVLGIIALRALSGLGSLVGVTEGGSVMVISLVFVVANALCVLLLRAWIGGPADVGQRRTHASR